MEKLRIQFNNSESGTSQSYVSLETKNRKSQKNRQRSFHSWCAPRKTRAVSSTGEIFLDFSSVSNVKKKKSKKRTKTQNLRQKVLKNQKRINELSRPRKMYLELSKKSAKTIKVVGSQKRINELTLPKRVSFESSCNPHNQSIKTLNLRSTSSLSLTNFGINKNTTNSKSISRREWMERINKLAEPRVRLPAPTNEIGKVAKKALNAIASKRIQELATKKPLKIEPIDSKTKYRDPYKVSPEALKAICSARTKSLATPKIFQLLSHY